MEADELRALFPGRAFGRPCAESELQQAEQALGEPLPAALRELYLAFDGFRGPTDATFLWPLFAEEGLVAMNQFYRGDPLFPQELVTQCLFFGDNGCGPQWGFKRDLPGRIIRWSAAWGTEFEVVGTSPFDAWRAEKEVYDALSEM
ncbi:SMI1/KNR4 family protein [Gemmata sp. SH-PL17]|uniref:SMI1/KNR4 family protein n=1 Tax=Gemmata sp. SH-PL17 TaxID=1630693 RepID=UPI0009EE065E|nr:SMI1/KNR4 family protein [Gemmata sp. SH-PL17]